jgi:hypothetical protein
MLVCEGVHRAHQKAMMIHRDLKPSRRVCLERSRADAFTVGVQCVAGRVLL